MPKSEDTPLLTSAIPPSLYPPFIQNSTKHQPYGIKGISHLYPNSCSNANFQKSRSKNWVTAALFLALIALGICIVVLLELIFLNNPNIQLITPLHQAAPNTNSYKDITIPQGTLRGFTKQSRQGHDYTAYFKVPYAEPPLGNLRFKDPISPRKGWQGIRKITQTATQCIQKQKDASTVQAQGDEDCLYANIYVSSLPDPSNKLLPVMVYTHGGGFSEGNGSRYGPKYFMDEPVILITFEWRLGPFGFLSSGDNVIRGNMGLKDQVQMLQWTRENIEHFGGDPKRVTVFGNSDGAINVGLLVLSPMVSGLISGAISQSGGVACMGMENPVDTNPAATVAELARVTNCNATDSNRFLECLQTKDAAELALILDKPAVYSLTLEKHENVDKSFMREMPYQLMKSRPNSVPYILGIVRDEWAEKAISSFMDDDDEQPENPSEDWVKELSSFLKIKNMTKEQLSAVVDFYFVKRYTGNDVFKETIDLVSDRFVNHCVYTSGIMHSEFSNSYLYYVNKPPYLSYIDEALKVFPAKKLGLVGHQDELQYLFLYDGYPEIKKDDQEYFEYSRNFVNAWVEFARNGKPRKEWEPAVKMQGKSTFWYELNDTFKKTDVMEKRMTFWDGFTHNQLNYEG